MLRADGDAEEDAARRRPLYERRHLETTPQMHTLDANQRKDLDDYYSSEVDPMPQPHGKDNTSTNRWLPALWTSAKSNPTVAALPLNGDQHIPTTEMNGNGMYNQITDAKTPEADRGIVPNSPKRRPRLVPVGGQNYTALPSTMQEALGGSNVPFSALSDETLSKLPTKETELQEDCSFFFRPLDTASTPRRSQDHHVWKSMRRDHHNRHADAMTYEYSDAVPVTPLPVLQHYRTRYAQLNQELIGERLRRQHHYHHDRLEQERDPFDDWHLQQSSLQLQEYDHRPDEETGSYYNANLGMTRGIVRCDTARQSSLFYRADGRLLMRLPRDRVRLLVDPDLEVGVLSVEQWRAAESKDETTHEFHFSRSNCDDDEANILLSSLPPLRKEVRPTSMNPSAPRPELRYVLTVSDDLYRKIVEEMSPTTVKYFCCNRACCNDEEKVDIRVAFSLFLAVLFVLFINMLAFREH